MSNAIDSNKQLFVQMQNTPTPQITSGVGLMPAIQKDKFVYYNDPEAIKKEKKKKTSKKLILGTTALASVAGIAATTVAIIKGKHYKNLDMGKTKEGLKKAVKFIENTGSNFSNVRDDITTKIVDKISGFKFSKNSDFRPFKFVDTLKNKAIGVYDFFLQKIAKMKYNSAYGELARLKEINPNGALKDIKIEKFEDWYENTYEAVKKALKEKSVTSEFFHKGMTPKEFWKKFKGEITASELLEGKISRQRFDITDAIKNDKEALAAVNRFNKVNDDIIEKMRDNALGNALGDFIGAAAVTGALGTGLALEENPDERKSTAINLGIPVGTTILGMIFGNALMLPAIKSMFVGFALGQAGSATAKVLDKPISKINEQLEITA